MEKFKNIAEREKILNFIVEKFLGERGRINCSLREKIFGDGLEYSM